MSVSIRNASLVVLSVLGACAEPPAFQEEGDSGAPSPMEQLADGQLAPPGFEVHTDAVSRGAWSWFIASHATPGQLVYFARGSTPAVPPPGCMGVSCLSIQNPVSIGSATADANGVAVLKYKVPNNLQNGAQFLVQAAQVSGGVPTPSAVATYRIGAPPSCAGDGMSWTQQDHNPAFNTDLVGCGTSCDAYQGNESCTQPLPILCLNQTGAPNPGIATNFYHGWAAGTVGLTPPVTGCLTHSVEEADALCVKNLGPGYRMGEHHDGGGGWNWWAYGNLPTGSEFWAFINDQTDGNCFPL